MITNRQIGDYVIYSEKENEAPFFVRMAGDDRQLSGPHVNVTSAVQSITRFRAADKRRG